MTTSTAKDILKKAEVYCEHNLQELCEEIISWKKTGTYEGSKFTTLKSILAEITTYNQASQIAKRMVEEQALLYVVAKNKNDHESTS